MDINNIEILITWLIQHRRQIEAKIIIIIESSLEETKHKDPILPTAV